MESERELRELDARVAVEVMGWKDVAQSEFGWHGADPDRGAGKTVPAFSSEIDSAWSVIEAMRAKGFDFELWYDASGYEATFWTAKEADDGHFKSKADTLGVAVCTASLSALAAIAAGGK